ncbi:MAG: hypothetical protein ACC645_15265 [Pirellulales bacterium]
MDYHLGRVWPAPADAVREDVVRFWLAESALPDLAAAQARAHQLVVVARDPNGQVAGVSTAVPTYIDRLGMKCFFYRTFVGRAHRAHGLRSTDLVWKILRESYRLLSERFRVGCDSDVLGLYAEIENPTIMRVRNDAIWRESGMNFVFIGRTQEGQHVRVWYFDGARIP